MNEEVSLVDAAAFVGGEATTEFLLLMSVTDSIKNLTSSSRNVFNVLDRCVCIFSLSVRIGIGSASELCRVAMHMENACRADNRAWKLTE